MKQNTVRSAIVIGAGFSGLSAAISLADKGFAVTLVERHDQTGGRARVLKEQGFTFDMGPSWYWMPEVAADFFSKHGRSIDNYLDLVRLDPSYQVIFGRQDTVALPASYDKLKQVFDSIEPGAGERLDRFMQEAGYKYRTAMSTYVNKPGLHFSELCSREVLGSFMKMDMLQSFSAHARKFFKDERLLRIIEFPVLFLGATADHIPAMYSMMNYADIKLGTWYPTGGMSMLVKAFTELAVESGVNIMLNTTVEKLEVSGNEITGVRTDKGLLTADVVVSGADYHHTDQELLPEGRGNYKTAYWDKRVMAPSCLIYYMGVSRKIPGLQHHNLFFENDLRAHAAAIYTKPEWPEKPLFYLCCPSKTDDSVAPQGMENLFVLIPTAPGLQDTPAIRQHYLDMVLEKTAEYCGDDFRKDIVYSRSYACSDFIADYSAFKGNAYGLANTLGQTAFLKPSIRHKTISNLFFTGQLTVPGPGVPPAIISGQVVADYISKQKAFIHESVI
ncbi:phytoene desaturase family protein [Chitinophaga rhizophila]|uniref:Phytoene desaturase n=1 Tax=Chitinophaga rhizophila TaxID=2866212 RepID=A0ABS7GII3_9BACT|nr:phytoene desaturase family protein [Chitinophaga rhizophila]MBW8687506.1 phytoene desaturase [Chitinophaga rhizophila]